MAANYTPVLVLRAIANSRIYQEKGKARIVRNYYLSNTTGKLTQAYQKMVYDIDVKGKGIFGRKIIATGTINDLNFDYTSKVSFTLSKKAHMDINARLEGCDFLQLEVFSNGEKKTNKVLGKFLGKQVDYFTKWRDTEGVLGTHLYSMYVEGKKQDGRFYGISKGTIGEFLIKGVAKETSKHHYEIEESYGPVIVKTSVLVSDLAKSVGQYASEVLEAMLVRTC